LPGDLVLRIADSDGPPSPAQTPPLNPPASGGRVGLADSRALHLVAVELSAVQREWSEGSVFDLEVDDVHSYATEMCVVHNCGCEMNPGWESRDAWTPPP
jgi:hypothetical protein